MIAISVSDFGSVLEMMHRPPLLTPTSLFRSAPIHRSRENKPIGTPSHTNRIAPTPNNPESLVTPLVRPRLAADFFRCFSSTHNYKTQGTCCPLRRMLPSATGLCPHIQHAKSCPKVLGYTRYLSSVVSLKQSLVLASHPRRESEMSPVPGQVVQRSAPPKNLITKSKSRDG